MTKQLTDTILMVSPDSFDYNPETAGSNTYQHKFNGNVDELRAKVNSEFDNMVNVLRKNNVNILILKYDKGLYIPDAVFPNNWFSTYSDGTLLLFPLLTENRRKERDNVLLNKVLSENKIAGPDKVIDLSEFEKENLILEGTGSLVLDRINNAVFAIESERTSKELFEKYCGIMNIEKENRVFFHAFDETGNAIYHTNVIMSIGNGFAVICDECIPENEREYVTEKLNSLESKVIKINYKQLNSFCGNILNVRSVNNESIIVMSKSAFENFTDEQKNTLSKYGRIIYSDIELIEKTGGGSARCMMAEIFFPKAAG